MKQRQVDNKEDVQILIRVLLFLRVYCISIVYLSQRHTHDQINLVG